MLNEEKSYINNEISKAKQEKKLLDGKVDSLKAIYANEMKNSIGKDIDQHFRDIDKKKSKKGLSKIIDRILNMF